MNESVIHEIWQAISNLPPERLNDPLLPLEHLDESLRHFQLEPVQSGRKRFVKESQVFTKDANFKDLRHEDLLDIRYLLYTGESIETAAIWAEKLLRFCEVRLNSLRQRAAEKCGSLREGRLLVLHLAAFLLDYADFTKDLRCLNTVLKLMDQTWILNEHSIQSRLRGKTEETTSALFEFRLLLVTKCMLSRLERGESL